MFSASGSEVMPQTIFEIDQRGRIVEIGPQDLIMMSDERTVEAYRPQSGERILLASHGDAVELFQYVVELEKDRGALLEKPCRYVSNPEDWHGDGMALLGVGALEDPTHTDDCGLGVRIVCYVRNDVGEIVALDAAGRG
jgi:hypothetical protein